jgi:membrane protease YdiL (CAAX protease family)
MSPPEPTPPVDGAPPPEGAPPPAADAPPAPGAPPVVFGAKRALWVLVVFLGTQLLVAAIAAVYAAAHNLRRGGPATPDGIQIDVRVTLGAALGGLLFAGLAALRSVRKALRAPGGEALRGPLGFAGASGEACVLAALRGLGLVTLFVLASVFLPSPSHDLGPLAHAASQGGWARVVWGLIAIAIAPPAEELVFRGALYAGLARSWRPGAAAVVTTAVFVGLHLTEVGTYWPAWIAIGTLGALALRERLRAGSLLPAIALHAGYNAGLVLLVALLAALGK